MRACSSSIRQLKMISFWTMKTQWSRLQEGRIRLMLSLSPLFSTVIRLFTLRGPSAKLSGTTKTCCRQEVSTQTCSARPRSWVRNQMKKKSHLSSMIKIRPSKLWNSLLSKRLMSSPLVWEHVVNSRSQVGKMQCQEAWQNRKYPRALEASERKALS